MLSAMPIPPFSVMSVLYPFFRRAATVSYGSFFCDYTMGVYGSATIKPLLFNIDLTLSEIEQMQVYVIYQNPSVTVSRNNAITPIQKYLGTVSSLWGTMAYNTTYSTYTTHQSSQTNECDIFQAAYYYFNGAHEFSNLIASSEYGIIIHASTEVDEEHNAKTTFPGNEPKIEVFNGFENSSDCIGSVLHELGHAHHFYLNELFNNSVTSIIKESFASYVGWYLGELYYFSKGYVLPFAGFPVNDQNRQDWSPNTLDHYDYSPLFVDLTDDYNQTAINDPISGVPVSVINNMIACASNVAACKTYLTSYVGTYYTATELNSYFAQYE